MLFAIALSYFLVINLPVRKDHVLIILATNRSCCCPQNVMSVRMPSTIPGKFVLVASYFHNSDDEGILRFVVTTGDKTVRAKMSILSCR